MHTLNEYIGLVLSLYMKIELYKKYVKVSKKLYETNVLKGISLYIIEKQPVN